jgi:hydroxyacylglutathione hydrolase
MLFRLIYDDALAHASYLIGCQKTGEAIVIDPARDVDRYFDMAAKEDLRLVSGAETHIHADYLSGLRELGEKGLRIYASDEGGPDWRYGWLDAKRGGGAYDAVRLHGGDEFAVGNIRFRTIHTPGHTPEHVCFEVTDLGGGAGEPMGVLTGDFVFVGDVGRPDLLESAAGQVGAMEPSARILSGSLRAFGGLEDYLQVWPAHGSGSACGKDLGAVPQSTVGYEKRFNRAWRMASDEDAFVAEILGGQPEPPPYFARMKRENRDGPAVLGALPRPVRMACAQIPSDAVVLDCRPWDDFRRGHRPGSLNAPIDRQFTTAVGSYIEPGRPIVLVADSKSIDPAVRGLVRVGLDEIAGVVDPVDLEGATQTIEEITVKEAFERLSSGRGRLVDVRRRGEFEDGHAAGAEHAPHVRMAERAGDLAEDEPLLCMCRSGKRSARACALLQARGKAVVNVAGGFVAWEAAGLPLG